MNGDVSFDLVTQPFIKAGTPDGVSELSLLDTFGRAGEVDLDWSNPLETAAVLRQLVLPVYWRSCALPRSEVEWNRRFTSGFGLDRIPAYLRSQVGRFNLFDPQRPFAQVARLSTAKGEMGPSSLLVAAMATGNNAPLFTESTEADPPGLNPGAAARALLATQCWDTAAIKSGAVDDPQTSMGKTTGNPPGPLGELGLVVPVGRNLAETLVLNTPIVAQGLHRGDLPQWEQSPHTAAWTTRSAQGLLDLVTWQSRRIRLQPERLGGQVVVRQALVAAGDRLEPLPTDLENHTAWVKVTNPKGGQAPVRPIRHQPGKAAWRGLDALLSLDSSSNLLTQCRQLAANYYLEPDYPLQIVTVGVVYGNMRAVVEDVVHDRMPLPLVALLPDGQARGIVLQIAAAAESLRVAANHLDDDLRRAQGAEPIPWDRGMRLGESLIADLDPLVRRFLAGAQANPDQIANGLDAWKAAARRCALDLLTPALDSTPDTAVIGRFANKDWHRLAGAEASYRRVVNQVLPIPRTGSRSD